MLTPSLYTLRPDQAELAAKVRAEFCRGKRRVVAVADTAFGKTVLAGYLCRRTVERGKRFLFVADARRLVDQAAAKIGEWGVPCATLMAGERFGPGFAVVASKQTMLARETFPPADLVVVDECHRGADGIKRLLDQHYPKAHVVGLTATPALGTGEGLGHSYEALVEGPSTVQLVKAGHKVGFGTILAPHRPQMPEKAGKGDWTDEECERAMDRPKLTGDIVQHWLDHGERRPTLAFASSVRHSLHLRDAFVAQGVNFRHLDGTMPKGMIDDALADFKAGRVEGLVSCMLLGTGVDLPWASCAVLARPTRSFVLFRQTLGRVMRRFDGSEAWPRKETALLLDHAGAVHQHGFPDDDVEWSLDAKERVEDRQERRKSEGKVEQATVCPKCFTAYRRLPLCPTCGHRPVPASRGVQVAAGRLVEASRGFHAKVDVAAQRNNYWNACLAIAAHKPRTCKMAYALWRQKFAKDIHPFDVSRKPTAEQWGLPVSVAFPGFVREKRG